jgi:hypothetical protein
MITIPTGAVFRSYRECSRRASGGADAATPPEGASGHPSPYLRVVPTEPSVVNTGAGSAPVGCFLGPRSVTLWSHAVDLRTEIRGCR